MMLRGKKKYSREVSLFEPIGQDREGNEIHLMDVIEQQHSDIVEELTLQGDIKKLFQYMEESLTKREQEILILRYGIGTSKELTQTDVGEKFGISRSYVSRIEKKALQKLKNRFETNE